MVSQEVIVLIFKMAKNLRSTENYCLGDVKYGFHESFLEDSRGLRQRQAPTGADVIGRVIKLTKGENMNKSDAYSTVADELSEFWIYGLNIYPLSTNRIKDKVKAIYEGTGSYKSLKKSESRGGTVGRRELRCLMTR